MYIGLLAVIEPTGFRSRPTGEVAGVLLLAVAAAHLDQLDRRVSSVAILTFAAPAGK